MKPARAPVAIEQPSRDAGPEPDAADEDARHIEARPVPDIRFLADAKGRSVAAFIPPEPHDEPMPVVLFFHRRLRNGQQGILSSELAFEAQKHRFVILAPDSPDSLGWPEDSGDRALLALRKARKQVPIDLRRVYLIGDESGNRYANDLACALPFAGVATAFDGHSKTCEPVRPIPRMRMYGVQDPQTPPQGGFGCNLVGGDHPSAETIINKWRASHKCSGDPTPWENFTPGTCLQSKCKLGMVVECAMDLGHRWPGANGVYLESNFCPVITPAKFFPMAEAVWHFFSEYGRPLSDAEVAKLEKAVDS